MGHGSIKTMVKRFSVAGRAMKLAATAGALIGVSSLMVLASAQVTPVLQLQRTITLPNVKGRIDHMAFDAKSNRLFVAALGNNTVEILDVQRGSVLHTISGFHEPQGVLFIAEANRLYVANGGDGTVQIFDGASYTRLKTINLGKDADNIRFDPLRRYIYIGYGSGGLAILQEDGSRVGDIQLGAHPESFQLERSGSRIFVNLPDAHKVAVVDRNARAVTAEWKLGPSGNFPMALDEQDHRLYIVCRMPPELLALDTETGKIVARTHAVGDSDDIFYDAADRRIFATGGEGVISAFQQQDSDHLTDLPGITTRKGARTSFFSPETRSFFVAAREQNGQPAVVYVYAVRQ